MSRGRQERVLLRCWLNLLPRVRWVREIGRLLGIVLEWRTNVVRVCGKETGSCGFEPNRRSFFEEEEKV